MYFFLVIPRVVVPPTPALPSAPPADEGYDSGGNGGRGTIRPHSVSPFTRNVRPKGEENEDEEMVDFDAAIACLVNLSTRREVTTMNSFGEENVTVRTFSTPTTPAATPRPEHPPRIVSRRILPIDTPRPRPLHRASAALGAPPRDENSSEEEELPDIPESPASPTYSDVTVHRLVYFVKRIS